MRKEIIEKWFAYANNNEVLKVELMNMNEEELQDSFYTDLTFGTGGMRGIIGAGTNRINVYTLRRANYGYGKYILRDTKKENHTVVIAYDNRRMGEEFAKETARVLATLKIKVYLFNKITPTPELSFAVRYLNSSGGVVITASHNPPEYNGYKIYDSRGCQLVPELADIVISEINNAPDVFNIEVDDFSDLVDRGMIEYLDNKIDKAYLECVKTIAIHPILDKKDFKIVFTPLHGTSAYLGMRLMEELGYNIIPVKEQMIADPNFSTVKSPNPEVGSAFDYAIKYAIKNNADICIATDPDADRVGLAVKNNDGKYQLLTGNQTGALLLYYIVNNKMLPNKGVVFNTIVTSSLGAEIAKSKGLEVISTLTGFKFIGEQASLLENTDKEFVFGYEESYGYVIKDFVRDKDSLQALLLCSEMACFYKNNGKNLIQVLEEIYEKYGTYREGLANIELKGLEGNKRINTIMDYFRNNKFENFGRFNVAVKEDYQLSKCFTDTNTVDIRLPKSNVIKYFLEDGSWFVLRPSGTEPKMKVYIAVKDKTIEKADKKVLEIENIILDIIGGIE